MIVNPQVFNYRFTIGTLVVAFTVLAAFSYTSYTSAQSKEEYFKQEKKLLENQISKIISSYDELGNLNKGLKSEIDNTNNLIAQTQDSLEDLKANISLINTYKNELLMLKKQQLRLLKKEDSFSLVNKELVKQNTSIAYLLDSQIDAISTLKEEKEKLNKDLKKAALVSANSIEATAFTTKKTGDIIETNKADKTNNFKIAFVLAENPVAAQQEKDIYIQIIGPNNNVVSDKGAIEFDESSLIYSHKTRVFYSNIALEVSANIETDEALKSGRYLVNVFDNNIRLGSTEIILL